MNGNKSEDMRRYIKYLFAPVILSAAAACVQQIEDEQIEQVELVTITFEAKMEGDLTKTTLEGNVSDSERTLKWLPSDEIAVYTTNYSYSKFSNTNTEVSELGNFTGETVDRDTYYAVYPYSAVQSWGYSANEPRINIPIQQKYAKNSFATDMNPMVARTSKNEIMEFKNLCGLLVVNLKGEEVIKTISLAAYDDSGNLAKIAGGFDCNLDYESEPVLTYVYETTGSQGNMVTIDCGEGVQINKAEATPFHFVMVPGTYSRICVIVTTKDGKTMIKEGRNSLTVRRAEWVNAGALQYAEAISIDLSEIGNSNCYVVSKAGAYHFDANVIGNGEYGFVEAANFHTTSPYIAPTSAELLWEDRNGVVTAVALKDNKITFLATGQEGNAAIAAKDADGNVIWSWHIWVTDKPFEQVYVNDKGAFTMLDRNIGAIRADRGEGEEYRQSEGLRYQWGRKDPYAENKYNYANAQLSIAESILLPTTLANGHYPWAKNWDKSFWSKDQKTIYDPCPVGYRVPPMDVWYGFSKSGENVDRVTGMNVSGGFDYGFNFIYDGSNTAWYPVTGCAHSWWETWNNRGRLWSAENDGGGHSYYLNYYYASTFEAELYIKDHTTSTYYGYSVRCMKDESHVDTSYPTVKITGVDVTAETADVVANVTDQGISEITERGILWGLTSDLTFDNAAKAVAETAGDGEYTIKLNGLQHATVYYVRPYAVNERGFSYGKVTSFRTTYAGAANDLSAYGTSNCYQVEPAYCKHFINGSVKGSGYESIGAVASVEVLWETNGIGYRTEPGTVIFDVTLKDGNIYFYTNGVEGNALIASKDALGNILWSWHIWVTDTPEDQPYGYYWLLDRNLGAVSAEEGTGEQWKLSCGLEYQWGRKDPFAAGAFTEDYAYYSVESSIANPMVYDYGWSREDYYWSESGKTVYDPCPVGYRVAVGSALNGISAKASNNNHGSYFYFDSNSSVTYWYPYRADHSSTYITYDSHGFMLTASRYNGYYWCDNNSYHTDVSDAHVRCMKDEGYVDMSYPLVEMTSIKDITSTGSKFYAEITNTGIAEITSKGFIWGTTSDLSLENGTKIECGNGSAKFTATLTGLSHSTRYYVRAYATNERGTSYSDVKTFYTPYDGNAVNLSRNGTANCYIVPVAYSDYVFNASVKGNSTESVGSVASVEVLWETRNTKDNNVYDLLEVGDVIESVELEGTNGKFRLPFDPKPGNALIAVKDANGTILWSWHIWVVDYDPVATQQTYKSGAVMMDRNLGALTANPSEIGSTGMMYQWGRKDPFVGAEYFYDGWGTPSVVPADAITVVYNNSADIDLAIANPTVVYDDATWGYNASLWKHEKTVFDPCPAGWRVPDKGFMDNMSTAENSNSYITFPTPYSTPAAYYPCAGFYDGSGLNSSGSAPYLWTSSYERGYHVWKWNTPPRVEMEGRPVDFRMSVRCMKDDPTKDGGNEGYTGSDYEW